MSELARLMRILRDMGPVAQRYRNPDPQSRIIDDKTWTLCACNKRVEVTSLPARYSGVVKYVDNICRGCEDRGKGLASVVCVRCHRVAGRMPPSKDKYGFKIEAGKVYHVQECPVCKPSIRYSTKSGQQVATTPIIEMLLWHRKMGVKS